jgi:hypothetical protein
MHSFYKNKKLGKQLFRKKKDAKKGSGGVGGPRRRKTCMDTAYEGVESRRSVMRNVDYCSLVYCGVAAYWTALLQSGPAGDLESDGVTSPTLLRGCEQQL